MPKYYGAKLVTAVAMTRLAYNQLRGWDLPPDENGDDEGYLVEYADGGKPNHPDYAGYISWSPKEQFDKAYRKVEELTFGLATEAAKAGNLIQRKGWNDRDMHVRYVPEHTKGDQLIREHFVIKNVDGSLSTWVPSINDVFGTDWRVL